MGKNQSMKLLVGDNPFHGISHLSQERSRARVFGPGQVEYAAKLVMSSIENGADGFMFSVSETTLAILETILKRERGNHLELHAIVPYAYEYVRVATQAGGFSGLMRKFVKQMAVSMNVRAMAMGLRGAATMDPSRLIRVYVSYEISRIKKCGKANLNSILLHELITDMALALNLEWFVKAYIEYLLKLKIRPGFETRNFAYLIGKFKDWNVDFREVTIATPFNKVGFQMTPSKIECEKALLEATESNVIAMSILAAGYIKPPEAVDYIKTLPNVKGVVVGVSRESHVRETFKLLREKLCSQDYS